MAIRITQSPKFTVRNIAIEIANEKGGWDRNTMDATFLRADHAELDELRGLNNVELITRKLTGWAGVKDDDGNEVEFTPENLQGLLCITPVVVELTRAFWGGQVKARAGN